MSKSLSNFLPLYDVICSLLEKHFSTWEKRDQIEAVRCGRPQVTICANKRKEGADAKFQFFKRTWYYRFDWICGSTYLQNIHCWPCLLYAKESDRWMCEVGFEENDSYLFEKHARGEVHVSCVKKLSDFKRYYCKRTILEANRVHLQSTVQNIPPTEDLTSNDAVQRNRQCAQFAVDAILFMVKKQLPLVQEDETLACSHADLVHLLMSQSSNEELKNHFRRMRGDVNPLLTKPMLQGVLESVSECIEEYILAAVTEAKFFSLRIDDGLNESSDCALFIRIVSPNNDLKEFFLGSYSLGSDRTSLSLFRILDSLLEKYEYKSKLIGISFDITCIKFNYLKDLNVGLKFMAQQSTNVNLFGHTLDYVLEKCLNRIPACRQFFVNLNALFNLTKILVKRGYCPNSDDWREVCNLKRSCCSKFKLMSAMVQDWPGMLSFFKEIHQETMDLEDVPCLVSEIFGKLRNHKFVFLVVFFRHLFQLTNALFHELRGHCFDAAYCQKKVKDICVILYRKRNDSCYSVMFEQAGKILYESCQGTNYQPLTVASACSKPLFYEILDNIIMELYTRFENIEKQTFLEFGNLLHSDTSKEFIRDKVRVATSFFPNIFKDRELLEGELMSIVHLRRFAKISLLNTIYRLRGTKENTLVEAYNMLSIITLLTPTPQKFPCLHEFSGYLKDSDGVLRDHMANILMNKDILNALSNKHSFKDDVLNKLSVKFDAVKLSHMVKMERRPENVLGAEPNYVLGLDSNLLITTVTASDMVVELDPTAIFTPDVGQPEFSEPGPSTRMEPDSSMMEPDIHLAMTCEVYPADAPQPDSLTTTIKEEPIDPDTYKQDILSATVMHELRDFSKDSNVTSKQPGSLFQPPIFIKEEPISSEDET